MTTEWSHLPNAIYIDRVLASVKAHPAKWASGYDFEFSVPYSLVWGAALSAALDASRDDIWRHIGDILTAAAVGSSGDSVPSYAYYSARDTTLALIAYDDSAHLLDSTPEEIRLLDALGHPYAVLLLGAATAFANINTTTSA